MTEQQRRVASHQECPDCGSRDALDVFNDHTYCHSCEKWQGTKNKKKGQRIVSDKLSIGKYATLQDRRIKKSVCEHYGVTVAGVQREGKPHITKHFYPNHNKKKEHVANKIRVVDTKEFHWEGKPKDSTLFGMHVCKGKKIITITEGELDTLAGFQMSGERYNYVSIINGVGNAVKDIQKNFEELDKFDEIYICFDNEEKAQLVARQVAMMFDGKAKIVELDDGFKDPCDYLLAGKEKEYMDRWFEAEFYVPSEIITGDAILDLVENYVEPECFDYPWKGLNETTFGYRLGETVALVAQAKIGKTYIIREILHHVLHNSDHKVGTIFLEGLPREHILGMMSLEADIPFHRPDAEYTEKELDDAKDKLPTDRICFYKRQGVVDIDEIVNLVRYYIRAMGCKVVVLDNLMSLVSDYSTDRERELLNQTITRLVKLGEDTETAMILVAHLNRQDQIHGTSLLEKQAHMVIKIERDKLADTPDVRNTTEVYVTDNRFTGDTGLTCLLKYDRITGRLNEASADGWLAQKEKTKHHTKKKRKPTPTNQPKDEFHVERDYEEPDLD